MREIVPAWARLELLVTTPAIAASSGVRSAPGSKPPWNAAAAYLIMDLHSEVRRRERLLCEILSLPARPRGGSDGVTARVLARVAELASSAGSPHDADTARYLDRWHAAARRVLGEASEIRMLPRQPGEPERPCPFCDLLTLRYLPLHGIVKCLNPRCRDADGRRPSARVEWSEFTRQLELVWHDGVAGLPAF